MNKHMGAGIAIGIGVGGALGSAMGNVGAGIAIGIADIVVLALGLDLELGRVVELANKDVAGLARRLDCYVE